MKKITIENIERELSDLNMKLLSNEYVKWRVLRVVCSCGREFKAKIYDIRKGKRCIYCNNKHNLIGRESLTNKEIKQYLKNPELFEIKRDKDKWNKYLRFRNIPINILEQIKILVERGYSDFQVSSRIRKYNNYIISRSKIRNLRNFL